MKSAVAMGALLIVVFGYLTWPRTSPAAPEDTPENQPFEFWMEMKLQESQKIFAALAEADYAAIAKSADGLKALNRLEGFVRRSAPGYKTQLRSFEFAVDEIRAQAKARNIEGVALGFHQMTLSCVNCHKQLRGRRGDQAQPQPLNRKE